MLRPLVSLLILFSSCCMTQAQEVKVSEVTVIDGIVGTPQLAGNFVLADKASKPTLSPGRFIEIVSDAANIEVEAVYGGMIVDAGKINSNSFIVPSTQKMTLRVRCVDFDKKIYSKKVIELAGEEPDVKPDPVDPVDPVVPVPGKIDNLSVLIVHESGQLSAYTQAQRNIIQSTQLREWMDKNVPKDSQGLANWRVLDKDTRFPDKSDLVYKKWLQSPPIKLPYLIIGNKDTIVYQNELPTNVEEIKALITKFKK